MKTTKEQFALADALTEKMSVREKLDIIIETSPANERLGIPKYYHGNEALHGVVRPGKYTVFPQAIALGAMFDDELLKKISDAISTESRARYHNCCADGLDEREFEGRYNGLLTFWSPDLNIARDPRWGRTAETYGEDPYLAGKCGAAFVSGLQGDDPDYIKAVATPKHFTGNNEEHNRFECNAVMSEKSLREYYLEPFRICIEEAHPAAVMAAYNAINGIPCHENKRLLTDILRGEWGFDGYVVSDCSAVARIWDSHKRYEDPADAASAALNAGVDLECGGYAAYEHMYTEFLAGQLEKGVVSEERINEAVRNVLVGRIKAGQFTDEKSLPWAKLPLDVIGCRKHSDLSYEAAVKSAVLLKNDGILPLKNPGKTVVVGSNAEKCQFGDYSGKPVNKPVSIYDGIKKYCPDAELVHWNYIHACDSFRAVPAFCYVLDDGTNGVSAAFYDNPRRAGIPKCRVDEAIDYEWLGRYPDPFITTQEFSCLFRGNIMAPLTGKYSFRVSAHGYKDCCPPKLVIDGAEYDGETLELKKGEKLSFSVTYTKQLDDPKVRLEWTTPCEIDESELFTDEITAAQTADTVIVALGLGTEYESEGKDKICLDLPAEQLTLLSKLSEVAKNIILIVENGSALVLKQPAELSRAVLEAWYPGDRGGDAIADIIFGAVSPSGRLPLGFPEKTEDLPPFDDYEITNGRSYMYRKKPCLYEFGYGLSYTTFEYSSVKADTQNATVTVKNTGNTEADEVAQLYIDSAGIKNQPVFRLRGFKRVHLKPGESKDISFPLDPDAFALYDENGQKKIIPGKYTVYMGGHLPDKHTKSAVIIVN